MIIGVRNFSLVQTPGIDSFPPISRYLRYMDVSDFRYNLKDLIQVYSAPLGIIDQLVTVTRHPLPAIEKSK